MLLTSELVTNAITYGSGLIYVEVSRLADRLRVCVDDDSPELPRYPQPGVVGENGRGLMLVNYLSTEWGISAIDMGKRVWLELWIA